MHCQGCGAKIDNRPGTIICCFPPQDAMCEQCGGRNNRLPNAASTQIGGDHYKSCAIQPVEYIEANSLPFLEGCVVKRVTRHAKPTGKGLQDIDKAIHELQLIRQLRYGGGDG